MLQPTNDKDQVFKGQWHQNFNESDKVVNPPVAEVFALLPALQRAAICATGLGYLFILNINKPEWLKWQYSTDSIDGSIQYSTEMKLQADKSYQSL